MKTELERIYFIALRDGDALPFIERTYNIYRSGIFGGHQTTEWMRNNYFRKRFIESLLVFRAFINSTRK